MDVTLINDWVNGNKEKSLTSAESYQSSVNAIKISQAVVLEGTIPTAGVGQQLEISLSNKIPVLLITQTKNTDLGKFTSLDKQKLITVKTYNLNNINSILKDFVNLVNKNHLDARFNLVINKELNNYLENKAKLKKTSKTEEIRSLIIEDMKRPSIG